MYILICIVFFSILIMFFYFTPYGKQISDYVRFFIEGKDLGFSFSDLALLWRVGAYTGLENKTRLFWYVPALDECIKFISKQVENLSETKAGNKLQNLLTKLYDYRTKVELKEIQKRGAMDSTRQIKRGQICTISVSGEPAVYGKLKANTYDFLIFALFEDSAKRAEKISWNEKLVKIDFWRQDGAGYIFSAKSIDAKRLNDHIELRIKHSADITQTQKRKSVRVECEFDAYVCPLKTDEEYNSKSIIGGIPCTVKDISEDGAMFTVKGKALKNTKMKLQFKINNAFIIMCGKIVRFSYDAAHDISKVNLECEFLEQKMKNIILSFVYKIPIETSSEFISTILSEEKNNENVNTQEDSSKEEVNKDEQENTDKNNINEVL